MLAFYILGNLKVRNEKKESLEWAFLDKTPDMILSAVNFM